MNQNLLLKARRDLQYMRIRYKGRRPAAETLLNEFDLLLDDAEVEISKVVSEKEHDIDMQYSGRLKQAEKREDDARGIAVAIRKENESLRRVLEGKRVLKEERERDGDDVKVTIERGVGGWSVADIEEIAYRLRAGGATDETEVHLSTTRVAAHVPDPNVVTLGGGREIERPHPATMTAEAGWPWNWARIRLAFYLIGSPVMVGGLTYLFTR